jgi:hypothetical protein
MSPRIRIFNYFNKKITCRHCLLRKTSDSKNYPPSSFLLISCPPLVRLAKYLQEELETDNDELLYQSARKLFITEFQTIVYKEFLPLLLGKRFMGIYKLDIGKEFRGL